MTREATASTVFFLGIDPGLHGGIAKLFADGRYAAAMKMPDTERDLLELLQAEASQGCGRAMLELVRASPQMGVVSAWKFGVGYGALRMALAAAEIPFDEVTPAKWQRAMQCLTGGDKNVSKRRAQELFPGVAVYHWNADALLLAEYGRRRWCGVT